MDYQIKASSELMKNNKQAAIMSPQAHFKALQTSEGHTLFFSIGTDGIFYLTRELPDSETGWEAVDLSSTLSDYHASAVVTAKCFEVSQDLSTNKIDVLLAITCNGQDYLYTAMDLENADATWQQALPWLIQAYDGSEAAADLNIVAIYVAEDEMSASAGEDYAEYIVVDTLPSNQLYVDRYYVDPSKTLTNKIWNSHDLAMDVSPDQMQTCLGKQAGEWVAGLYTFGILGTERQLIYTPLYNVWDPSQAANPSRLTISDEMDAIAISPNPNDGTDLFVVGNQQMYYFAADQQQDGATGTLVLAHDLFLNVTQLYANANRDMVVVWGVNQQGQVFYTSCPLIGITQGAWSEPMMILSDVTQISTYLNNSTTSKVLFALSGDVNMIKLSQDPVTSVWKQSNILLPSTDVNDVYEMVSYTTHIQLLDAASNLPAGGVNLLLSSTSPVSVYINNKFKILSPDVTLSVSVDSSGILTILQETTQIGCVCYYANVENTDTVVAINPMQEVLATVLGIQTGDDLANITVMNEDGSTEPLMPEELTDDDLDALAQAIQQVASASKDLPADGSLASADTTNMMVQPKVLSKTATKLWGLKFESGSIRYYEGEAAEQHFAWNELAGARLHTNSFTVVDAIATTVGDIYNWVCSAWDDVTDFFVSVADKVYNCFITIAGQVYNFVLDCIEAVLTTIQMIFDKITLLIEDLIKWLGFLFQWDDILRTHDVFKNILLQYSSYAIDKINDLENSTDTIFDRLQAQIDAWAGLTPTSGYSLTSIATSNPPLDEQYDPQTNYGVYHFNNGLSEATLSSDSTNSTSSSDPQSLLDDLQAIVAGEVDTLEAAFNQFKTDVLDQLSSLDFATIIQRTVAILSNTLIECVQVMVDGAFELLKTLTQTVVDLLSKTVEIPVLSWLYEKIAGNPLSVLDAVALIAAIPATLLYKVTTNEVPFPDNATTTSLIQASSWEQLYNLISPNATTTAAVAHARTTDRSTEDILMITARYASTIGGFAFMGTSAAKGVFKDSLCISLLNFGAYFSATLPSMVTFFAWPWADDPKQDALSNTLYTISTILQAGSVGSCSQTEFFNTTWVNVAASISVGTGFVGMVPPFNTFFQNPSLLTATTGVTSVCSNSSSILGLPAMYNNVAKGLKLLCASLAAVGQGIAATEMVFLDD